MMTSDFEGGTDMTHGTGGRLVEERIRTSVENLVFALGNAAGADRASLFLVDEERGELRLAVGEGLPLPLRIPLPRSLAGLAWERGEPIRVDDAYTCERFHPDVDALTGYRTCGLLCIPVRSSAGRVAAVLELLNPIGRSGFTLEDERELREDESELSALLGACGSLAWDERSRLA
jgi:GAF domain-containing protein